MKIILHKENMQRRHKIELFTKTNERGRPLSENEKGI